MILLYDYVDIATKWQEMLLRPTIMCCQLVVPASPWHRYLRGMDSEHRLLVFALVSRISTRLPVKSRSLNQQVVASSYGEVTPALLLGLEASFGKSLEAENPWASMLQGLVPRPEPRRPQRRSSGHASDGAEMPWFLFVFWCPTVDHIDWDSTSKYEDCISNDWGFKMI